MSGRRVDVSATQVVASMLAAVTGAVAASTLGIAGTVIGAAVMSVASTMVAAVYKHYIARSHERLRAAAEAARVSPLVSSGAVAALRSRQRTAHSAQHAAHPDGTPAVTQADGTPAMTQADVTQADVTQADVTQADVTQADVTQADGTPAMTQADVTQADVTQADVTQADVTQADVARLAGQRRVTGADADQTEVFPAVGYGEHRWHDADRANGFATQIVSGKTEGATAAGRAGPDEATQLIGRTDSAAAAGSPTAAAGSPTAAAASPTAADGAGAGEATRVIGGRADGTESGGRTSSLAGTPAGDDRADAAGDKAESPGSAGTAQPRWRRPLALAGMALAVFLLAMASITVFEAVAGKPLDAVVGGKHGSGTTVGGLIGGQSTHTASHHTGPVPSPTPTPSGSGTPSPTPSPTPTTTTPSPTPSPSTTPSAGHTSGASPGPPASLSP
jgi:hypothetical protein